MVNLVDGFHARFAARSNKAAIRFEDWVLMPAEIDRQSTRLARALRRTGGHVGDLVGIKTGTRVVPIQALHRDTEIMHIVQDEIRSRDRDRTANAMEEHFGYTAGSFQARVRLRPEPDQEGRPQ